MLPEEFIRHTREIMGESLFATLTDALAQDSPTSIRMNPWKWDGNREDIISRQDNVPWCPYGVYLTDRPNFTFDPLLHAGVYYVQEASSMFIDHVLRQYVKEPVRMLDLCAAPGGKTTCAAAALPEGSILYSNEPIRNRAQILSENTQKWLIPHNKSINGFSHDIPIITTSNYPKDYRKAKAMFDVILCDVPCSGEGMFRKDKGAIAEWSTQNVKRCQQLQREIVGDIWHCLQPGGLLIYSTCTFNTYENEENIAWICNELGATILPVETDEAWGITGSLLKGFDKTVYRFIPGKTVGEGLFMAVLRKGGEAKERINEGARGRGKEGKLNIIEPTFLNAIQEASEAPHVELTYDQAISYLRREAITLPSYTPRGIVVVTYQGLSLGLAKNIGNRANNLYPKEWRIKSTYTPSVKYTVI